MRFQHLLLYSLLHSHCENCSPFQAMEIAEAGDIVELQEGTYEECLESVRDGEIDNPITIIGNENTIIKATESRAVRINHSHINLVVSFFSNGQ